MPERPGEYVRDHYGVPAFIRRAGGGPMPDARMPRKGAPVSDRATNTPTPDGSDHPMNPKTSERVQTTYSCGGCDTRWSGVSRCHCSACHRTFSGLRLFDGHRRDIRGVGTCMDPATVTTKAGEPVYLLRGGLWRSPDEFNNAGQLFT